MKWLYYLFLWDKEKNKLPIERRKKLHKDLKENMKNCKKGNKQ